MMEMMYSEGALRKLLQNNNQFIIAYNSGIPVGFACFSEIEPAVYKLHKIYVLFSQQGKGTGKFMIEQVINDIKPKGAVALRLNVNRDNPAKQFYEKMGFTVIASEDIDIGNGFFMNDYVMEKRLNAAEQFMQEDHQSEIVPQS